MDNDKTVNGKRKRAALAVFVLAAVIGAVTLYFYVKYKATHITTDDAFIEGKIHAVAAKIPGTVKAVAVADNRMVTQGELMVEIDPVDYEIRVREASAAVEAEKTKLGEAKARVETVQRQRGELRAIVESAKAQLELHEANFRQAETDLRRAERLYGSQALSRERYEKTKTGYEASLAQVRAAREQVKQAETSLDTNDASIRQAEAAHTAQRSSIAQKEALLEAAQTNYGYTKILALTAGFVTKKSVEVGNQVQAGQPLMAVVPLDDVWIVANYKETQLGKIRPGQKVEIRVDAYPGKTFHGEVDSIMAGTGAAFSLFPPENATGNYVKVVQRIPVKIRLDKGTDPDHILRIGMSVMPTVILER